MKVFLLLGGAILLSLLSVVLSANNVIIQNNKMMVNGVEFIVKGVDYSPAPIGQQGMNAQTGYGGTGFCSPKLTPWGEWRSACYDSDYYDGSTDINPARFPNGFRPIWERDFPYIKSLGANTIRLYNTNPSTKVATQTYTNLFTYPTGKDHTQFMKYCEQNGLYVVYPLFSDNWAYANYDEFTFKRYLRWQIDEVGNSSALLMWQLGNEMDWTWYWNSDWNSPAAFKKYNRYADYVRRYTLSKWGRNVPVTIALVNVQDDYNFQYQNFHVDIVSANVFGTSFGNLFSGTGSFTGITKLACQYNKPYLMTEIGPTWKANVPYIPGDFNIIWNNVIQSIQYGLLGGIYFEQTDEPALGKDFGLWGLQKTVRVDGTDTTLADVWIADTLVPKRQYYDVINGTYNGKPINMNTNFFTQLGRSPYTSSTAPDYCLSVDSTYKTCPGTGSPKCSGNGACDRTTGTCSCADGWTGTSCSTAICPGSPTACSGRGTCSSIVTPPECYCNEGYYGLQCENTVASVPVGQCPNGCKGNGLCNNATWTCSCWPGWSGPDCSVTDLGTGTVNIAQYYQSCVSNGTNLVSALRAPATTTLTNQKCRYYCGLRGYTYAATIGGDKCYCHNVNVASQRKQTTCTKACIGDSTQACGGSTTITVYSAGSKAKAGYIGCFIDGPNRDLPFFYGNVNDVDTCRRACSAAGYLYTGLQYGGQCFCGNSYGNQGGLVAESDCTMPCADNTLRCGNGWRNSIYKSALAAGYTYY